MIVGVSQGHIEGDQDFVKLVVFKKVDGQKKVKPVFQMKSSSTERIVKDLKILKEKGHLDFSREINAVSNGEAVREDGTTYRAIPLEAQAFVKIKKTILSSAPVKQE